MLYHANDGSNWRSGLVTSTDLLTWTRASTPTSTGQITDTKSDTIMYYSTNINQLTAFEHAVDTSIKIFDLFGTLVEPIVVPPASGGGGGKIRKMPRRRKETE